ncbi:MAG TPA: maleylpyruvate isomerase family mycothiol-dependent enzyme [Acidimicrobiia bacterium]|nr:maleylpyruvate isomerase family mycothiol-dependent enzyme [Acidimicrobiia bacterium]
MTEPLIIRLDEVWRDVATVCDGLTSAQWNTATECPGWTVHDNVAHMIGTERMLLGEQPASGTVDIGDSPHVRNDIGKANEQWIATYRGWDGAKLLDEFRAVTRRRLDVLRAMTTAEWEHEGFTPEGPGPYRLFMEIRLFDCWYHDQDIREALDRPGFLDGPVADLSVGRIPAKALGYVVGKEAGAPANTTVLFEITGASPILAAIAVPPEGRAVLLDAPPDAPTVSIAMDRRTFTRLAGGRWSAEHARAHGTVRIDGDTDLGNRVVDNLAFTI